MRFKKECIGYESPAITMVKVDVEMSFLTGSIVAGTEDLENGSTVSVTWGY